MRVSNDDDDDDDNQMFMGRLRQGEFVMHGAIGQGSESWVECLLHKGSKPVSCRFVQTGGEECWQRVGVWADSRQG